MCRSITKFFFGFLLFLFLIPAVVASIIVARVFDANFYTSSLEATGIYEQLPELVASQLKSEIDNVQLPEIEGSLTVDQDELATRIIEEVVPVVVDSQLIKSIVEDNIENVFGFLNGVEEDLYVSIPRADLKQKLDTAFTILFDEILPAYGEELPVCTEQQLRELYESGNVSAEQITCVPDFIDLEGEFDFSEFKDQLLLELETSAAGFFDGPERLPLEDFIREMDELAASADSTQSADIDTEFPDEDVQQALELARDGFRLAQIAMVVMWVVVVIITVLYFLTATGDIWHRTKSTLIPIGLSGAVISLIGLVISASFNIISSYLPMATEEEIPEEFIDGMLRLIEAMSRNFATPIIIVGIVMFIVAILGWYGLRYLPDSRTGKKP